ncbi:MAG: hypothetical protein M1835_003522, partial [Candelina submexicana]
NPTEAEKPIEAEKPMEADKPTEAEKELKAKYCQRVEVLKLRYQNTLRDHEALKAKYSKAGVTIKRLELEVEGRVEAYETLEKGTTEAYIHLNNEYTSVGQSLAAAELRHGYLMAEIQAMKTERLQDRKARDLLLNQKAAELKQYKANLSNAEENLAVACGEIGHLHNELEKANKPGKYEQGRIKQYELDLKDVKIKLTTTQAKAKLLEGKLEEVKKSYESDLASRDQIIKQSNADLENAQSSLATAYDDIERLRDELQAARTSEVEEKEETEEDEYDEKDADEEDDDWEDDGGEDDDGEDGDGRDNDGAPAMLGRYTVTKPNDELAAPEDTTSEDQTDTAENHGDDSQDEKADEDTVEGFTAKDVKSEESNREPDAPSRDTRGAADESRGSEDTETISIDNNPHPANASPELKDADREPDAPSNDIRGAADETLGSEGEEASAASNQDPS